MNDAELDDPILSATAQVKKTYEKRSEPGHTLPSRSNTKVYQTPAYTSKRHDPDDGSFTMPTKWWYASTAFPLITGTFGPMANAFSICALVENWRISIPPGATEATGIDIPDPKWLIAINAVSLVFALIANMSLLLNMTQRLKFAIAQPITIIGFWLSSVLLIALIAVASYDFQAPGIEHQALTQAYYYACWAAGLYQIISYLMCVTVLGAIKKKYDSKFNLTVAQRTLMLQTIAYFTYLLLGALVYSKIEGWRFLDAVYWADFTLLTVGIGDYAPATHTGRGLLFPFALGGIVILGLVVSSIRSLVLDRGKKKLSARMTENMRKKVVKEVQAIQNANKAKRKGGTRLKKDLLNKISQGPLDDPEEELERREAEFNAMRKVQSMSDSRQKWMNLSFSTLAFAVLWFGGAAVFWRTEFNKQPWTYFTSLYFSYTSLLTIGYGDFSPISNSGKPFFVFWSLLAIPSLTILISDMGDTVVKGIKDLTIWLGEITILPSDQGSILERLEYGIYKATKRNPREKPQSKNNGDDDTSSSDDEHPYTLARPPFFSREFSKKRKEGSKKKNDADATDRIAEDFEETERQNESDARDKGDHIAEDEHHYRHLLLSQIRKVYADTAQSPPKKYSYQEWAFFLKLLGEDESSSTFHRTAKLLRSDTMPVNGAVDHNAPTSDGINQEQSLRSWSWMGPRSPLMSQKHEPALLLEFLFQRLEETLKGENKHKEIAVRREPETIPEEEEDGSDISSPSTR